MTAKTVYKTGLRSVRNYMVVGLTAGALLVFGIGGWMATAELAGAVVAQGTVVVVSNVKKVQHPSGGVIGSIMVKEGQHVKFGTPLLRLDDTITLANLAVVEKSLNELLARQARLIGERDRVMDITFPKILNERATDSAIASLMESERRLLDFRRVARDGRKASIQERIEQFEQEVIGYQAQIDAKAEEHALVEKELFGARELWQKKLVSLSKLTALEREATRIKGEKGQLISGMAQTKGRIAEARLSILQIDHDLNSEVASELRDIDSKLGELQEREVAARDQLKHIELASTQDGTIHELAVHTIGGVVAPGEVLMLIVPSGENLEIETQVSPVDVDQLHIGAEALLRLTAFNQRTTPELIGKLSRISADIAFDQKLGASFYRARITIEASELAKLRGLELVPGMPVEVFVKTEDRKVFSLLLKPFTDQLYRAFREN
jgi:HlyD family secretion protein